MPGTHSQDVNQNLLMPKCPARWARTPGWAKGQAVPAPLWRTARPGTTGRLQPTRPSGADAQPHWTHRTERGGLATMKRTQSWSLRKIKFPTEADFSTLRSLSPG